MSDIIYHINYLDPSQPEEVDEMIRHFNDRGYSFTESVTVLSDGETIFENISDPESQRHLGFIREHKTLSDEIIRGIEQAGLVVYGTTDHLDSIVNGFQRANKSVEFQKLK